MPEVWDRNKARKILDALCDDCDGETELQRALDALEGCVRPVDSVTLTREEVADVARVLRNTGGRDALAARLEAAS